MKLKDYLYEIKVIVLTTLVLWTGLITVSAEKSSTLFEYRVRKGLPNVSHKLSHDDTLRVAYFGGSITAQAGWRVQSFDYLCKRFPSASFVQIDASMGGTGSQLGVLRMDKDVLKHNPDLVFVEFAVNDSKTPLPTVEQTMEGIVRKIWHFNPHCDICFVYTVTEALINQTGMMYLHPTVSAMERVATAYGIPSVYMPYDAIQLLSQDKLVMRTPSGVMLRVSGNELNESSVPGREADGKIYFSPDGVHPYLNTGHVLYMQVLRRALDTMIRGNGKSFSHSLQPLLSPLNYEKAKGLQVADMHPQGPWSQADKESSLYKNYSRHFDELWVGEVGATLDFTFCGRGLVCYDVISPEGCRLELTVDGRKFTVDRFDGYCTYARYHYAELVGGLEPDKEHTVHIEVISEGLDKETILFEQNRADLKANPGKYKPVHWLLNSLFVIP